MSTTFKVVVHRAWLGERTPDPETYFGGLDETIQLLDDVLGAHDKVVSTWPAAYIEIVAFDGIHGLQLSFDDQASALRATTRD
jgi:hypothetical protein